MAYFHIGASFLTVAQRASDSKSARPACLCNRPCYVYISMFSPMGHPTSGRSSFKVVLLLKLFHTVLCVAKDFRFFQAAALSLSRLLDVHPPHLLLLLAPPPLKIRRATCSRASPSAVMRTWRRTPTAGPSFRWASVTRLRYFEACRIRGIMWICVVGRTPLDNAHKHNPCILGQARQPDAFGARRRGFFPHLILRSNVRAKWIATVCMTYLFHILGRRGRYLHPELFESLRSDGRTVRSVWWFWACLVFSVLRSQSLKHAHPGALSVLLQY